MTLTALSMALVMGTLIGIATGLNKDSVFDVVVMRVIDVLMAFPFMVLALVVTALFGASLCNLLLVVISVWWVPFARMARSIVLQVKDDESVLAAKVLGASQPHIVFREVLPKVTGPIFTLATFELGTLILSISALSFLGMGAQPPSPEWGSMLSDARAHFFQSPYLIVGPSLFIILTVFSLNLIGEGMRDLLDPYESVEL
jgi:peptide/nickel transport system permease protein